MAYHEPVLVEETLRWLAPREDGRYLDATVGGGGHAERILEVGSRLQVVALDCDADAIEASGSRLGRFGERVRLIRSNFAQMRSVVTGEFDGVLFDLGVSSHQFDEAARGFSFAKDAPLDMRLDQRLPQTAADLIAQAGEPELERMLREYGDEERAKRIAAEIGRARRSGPIRTTAQLAAIVERVVPRRRTDKVAPATRTFMALRMAVNQELENLKAGLAMAVTVLKPGGRLAVISFHSGEDRVVKEFFRRESRDCICPPEVVRCQCGHRHTLEILTRKPVTPTPAEVGRNPRARSAKLRVAARTAPN